METTFSGMGAGLTELPESLRGFGVGKVQEGALAKVRYTHDAMIDLIISNPWISQNEIAGHFGYTVGWISQIFTSDVFQSRLAERKGELVDPSIRATIEDNIKALAHQSMAVLRKKLELNPSDDLALGVAEVAIKALGYGAKQPMQVNNQFVVQVPGKMGTSAEWAERHQSSVGSQEVARVPISLRGPVEAENPPIVSIASPRAPAPPLPDPEKLLAELVNS